jgi:hypothetical protein
MFGLHQVVPQRVALLALALIPLTIITAAVSPALIVLPFLPRARSYASLLLSQLTQAVETIFETANRTV